MVMTVKELAEYIPEETVVTICDTYGFVAEFAKKKLETCRFAEDEVYSIVPMKNEKMLGIQLSRVCMR